MNFVADVLCFAMSLLFLVYIIYGKSKRKSIIGGYKPGTPGYDVFLRFVNNKKYLVLIASATAIFTVNLGFAVKDVLKSDSSHSILIVVPIMVIAAFAISIFVLPGVLGKK